MLYVLAFVVLLLAAAMVALFAMLGELYTRIGGAPAPTDSLAEATVGQRPDNWPPELARLAAEDAVLLVLSTSCVTCNGVAGQLRQLPEPVPGYVTGVALSTPDPERADEFMARYGLPRDAVYVDQGGDWVTRTFGVQTSPSALFLRAGQVDSAVLFSDIAALRAAAPVKQTTGQAVPMSKEAP